MTDFYVTDDEFEPHPIAEIFPPMSDAQVSDLMEKIKEEEQLYPIILYQGKILDGRNRYRACRALGVMPKYQNFAGNDQDAYDRVASTNLGRMHYTQDQFAMAAAWLVNAKKGGDRKTNPEENRVGEITHEKAANMVGVKTNRVDRAVVIKNKNPALAQQVKEGKKKLYQAEKEIGVRKSNGRARREPKPVNPDNLLPGQTPAPFKTRTPKDSIVEAIYTGIGLDTAAKKIADTPVSELSFEDDRLLSLLSSASSKEYGYRKITHALRKHAKERGIDDKKRSKEEETLSFEESI